VYFAVEDCDTSLALAQSLGGSVFLPGMDMRPGRFGGVLDPTGGMFFLGHFPQGQG
jgi:predicted enzyme related to lactoylglutathione lyase